MNEVAKGMVQAASTATTVSIWLATAKKSSWFMAEFMTLRRIVSPGSTGNLTVSTLSKPQQM
jgi:hypothetical protein